MSDLGEVTFFRVDFAFLLGQNEVQVTLDLYTCKGRLHFPAGSKAKSNLPYIFYYTVKPVYSGHLGEIEKMTAIYR